MRDMEKKRPRRALIIGAVVTGLGLFLAGGIPVIAGATNSVMVPSATAPKLVLSAGINCNGCGTAFPPSVSVSPCYVPFTDTELCNVTFSFGTYEGISHADVTELNYTAIGQSATPTTFYFINSDPALPCTLGITGGNGVELTATFSVWFHTNEKKGTVEAFAEFDVTVE